MVLEMSREKKTLGQHIQSYARVRPFNKQEIESRAKSCLELQNREVLLNLPHASKRFCFDKVFDEDSKQVEVYNAVVEPLLCEVMKGYNCTVFAYGQTGTGKTYTMIGDHDKVIESATYFEDSHVGIIPRVLSNLFDKYVKMSNITVRVSYLELYNEILIDLLSLEDKALKLYEDPKSKGTVHIHGLEEVTVHDKNQVYEILRLGSERKITASTLMNVQSSRSHTVFTVTVHVRETMPDGEELVKTGKLHLVDLAGSENISKSGATDKRAREAGSINQSLLTLGRVIKTLVEKSAHVPYRESKLTRILQDSLGGKTKTAIIATVSPASVNVEETHSALEYAYRARVITNRPEVNERMSKSALIQKYVEEIDKLKKDLKSARNRDGVYLHPENYEEMITESNKQKAELLQAVTELSVFSGRISDLERVKQDLLEVHSVTKKELDGAQMSLAKSKSELVKLSEDWHIQQNLIDKYDEAQTDFHQYNKILSDALNKYVLDYRLLRNKVTTLRNTNDTNHLAIQQLHQKHKTEHDATVESLVGDRDALDVKCNELKDHVSSLCATLEERKQSTRKDMQILLGEFGKLRSREILTPCACEAFDRLEREFGASLSGAREKVSTSTGNIAEHLDAIVEKVDDIVQTGREVTAKVHELRRGFQDDDERSRKGEENLMETVSKMLDDIKQTMQTKFSDSRNHRLKYRDEIDTCTDYINRLQEKNETTQRELTEQVLRGKERVEEINRDVEAVTVRSLLDYKSLLQKYTSAVEHSNEIVDKVSEENCRRDAELEELSQRAGCLLQNLETISNEYSDFDSVSDDLTKRITYVQRRLDEGHKVSVRLVSEMGAVVDSFVEQYQIAKHEGDTPQKEYSIPKMKTPQLVKKDLFLRRRQDIRESLESTNGSETIQEESDNSA